jgi:hypothetical protein
LVGAFGSSWSVALVLWLTGGIASGVRHVVGGFAFMCGPALAALVVRHVYRIDRAALGLGLRLDPASRRWLLAAWAIPLGLVVAATLGSALVPGVRLALPETALVEQVRRHASAAEAAKLTRFPPGVLSALLVLQACVMGPLLNLPMMLSEELGWRGLLWSRWQTLGPWRLSALVGFFWGLWHAPLIAMGHNYPDAPWLGIPMMIAFCMLLTPTLHLVRARGGSVWHACLFHGTINATSTLAALCLTGASSSLLRGIVGLPGFAVLAGAALLSGPRPRASSRSP